MADKTSNSTNSPRVFVAERVIDKIVRGALLYPDPETGEAMIGLIVPQSGRPEPDIYVLDTISPGEHAVRQWGKFEHGDDWQGDVLHWMHVNWEAFREIRRPSYGQALAAKWDVPLMHVGEWHKQPGDMIEPSPGDLGTAQDMIDDPETRVKHLVTPIVTMYRLTEDTIEPAAETPALESPGEQEPAAGHDLTTHVPPTAIIKKVADQEWIIRIDFWYISDRSRRFMPIVPDVWTNDRLPNLPPVAWHLAHPKRFDQEYDLLRDAGYSIDVVRWDADGKPPYEICFSVYKPGNTYVVLLVTPVDYPATMPAIRIAPLVHVEEDEDVFEKLYEASEPVLLTQLPDWTWDSKRTLIELVWHVEKMREGDSVS
jgi:hypothetical protein